MEIHLVWENMCLYYEICCIVHSCKLAHEEIDELIGFIYFSSYKLLQFYSQII